MKYSHITLLSALCIAFPLFANANMMRSTAEVPATCQASLLGGDNLDWGYISRGTLNANGFTNLGEREITLQVQCQGDRQEQVAFWATDTNGATAQVGNSGMNHDRRTIFGLGVDPVTGKKLGNFVLKYKAATYGITTASQIGVGPRGSSSFSAIPLNRAGSLQADQDYTVLDNTTGRPARASSFSWTFLVEPQLRNRSEVSAVQTLQFRGSVEFNIRYL